MKGNKFNLNSLLNQSSKAQSETKLDAGFRIEYISVNDLIPAEENFYDVEHIENLKQGIELNGGIKQNLIVTPSEIDGKYRIIAGHRRHKASKELVDEGKKEYELLPCIVEAEIDTDKEQLMLIMTNSTTRELTDFEKTKQAEILKEILVKLKKKENITGRVREIIADILNTSPAQISRMESINKNLSEEFKDKFKEQKIGISAAYELSKKPKDEQKKVLEEYKESGDIKLESKKETKTETTVIEKGENYYWSFEIDSEIWMGPEESIEDCIKDAKSRDVKDFKSVFIGVLEEYIPELNAEYAIEEIVNLADAEHGEASENWLEHTSKEEKESLEKKLNKALKEWLEETNNCPNFGRIINVKQYDIETGEFKGANIGDKAALWPK